MSEELLAAPAGLEVRIMDHSDPDSAEPAEVVRGFTSIAHANQFARRYVRDSVERCRVPRASAAEVASAWFAFGEDAVVAGVAEGAPGAVWSSGTELTAFAAAAPRDAEDRNWRILDPRRLEDEDADDDDMDGEEEA